VKFNRRNEATAAPELASRLLPGMLREEELEREDGIRVLDLGRANRQTLDFFSSYRCRLQVLDAASSLLSWSNWLTNLEELPTQQDLVAELGYMFRLDEPRPFDFVLLWDTLNYLHPAAVAPFAGFLARHVATEFIGHGFLLHKRGVEHELRHCGIRDSTTVHVSGHTRQPLYEHNRKFINEHLPPLKIEHGILHNDGRLEFLLRHRDHVARAVA